MRKLVNLFKAVTEDSEFILPLESEARCENQECEWVGTLLQCNQSLVSDDWETPSYTEFVCPKCGEPVDY